jgi:hypothetical protein
MVAACPRRIWAVAAAMAVARRWPCGGGGEWTMAPRGLCGGAERLWWCGRGFSGGCGGRRCAMGLAAFLAPAALFHVVGFAVLFLR